jgi:hypothetical protein
MERGSGARATAAPVPVALPDAAILTELLAGSPTVSPALPCGIPADASVLVDSTVAVGRFRSCTDSCPATEISDSATPPDGVWSKEGDRTPTLDVLITRIIPARFARCQQTIAKIRRIQSRVRSDECYGMMIRKLCFTPVHDGTRVAVPLNGTALHAEFPYDNPLRKFPPCGTSHTIASESVFPLAR